MKKTNNSVSNDKDRTYVSQAEIPQDSLDEAVKIARALADNYASKPTRPMNVAAALNLSPGASGFRMLCGASIAYGLTTGGAYADAITLTALGKRVVAPKVDGDDALARKAAFLTPRIIGEFLRQYDGQRVPKTTIAENVLVDMGVPRSRAPKVFETILEGAKAEGLVNEIKDGLWVDLSRTGPLSTNTEALEAPKVEVAALFEDLKKVEEPSKPITIQKETAILDARKDRVYLSHGKNRNLVAPIKALVKLGGMEPVVSVERESTAIPVPDKVLNDMRSCGAAIIHVDDELRLVDEKGQEHVVLNDNVLIELGAAMAFYGKRIIIVVKKGIKMPSNLQGIYKFEYEGDIISMDDTIRLVTTINEMKSTPLIG